MRRESILELVLLALAAALAIYGHGLANFATVYAPPERDHDQLRVVTWNLGESGGRAGMPFDDRNHEHVAEVLGRLDADLIVLQELRGQEQLDRLVDELGPVGAHTAISGAGGRRVGVIARFGVLEDPVVLEGRGLAFVYRKPRPAGGDKARAAVAALHASAWSAEERNEEIGRAAELLAAVADPAAHLLMGDLNLDLDIDKRRDLFTNDEYLDVETYNFVASKLVDTAAGTGPTAEPDRRLDYVFHSPDELRVAAAGPWRGMRAGGMDHDPVVADFDVVGAAVQ